MRNPDNIIRGIAAYAHEQKVVLRVLRRYGPITSDQFDKIFGDFRITVNLDPAKGQVGYTTTTRKPIRKVRFLVADDGAFILGNWLDSGFHSKWLELTQCMARIEMIEMYTKNGEIIYKLPEETA